MKKKENKQETDTNIFSQDEFMILRDDTYNLVLGSDSRLTFVPTILYLTNKQIYIRPTTEPSEPIHVSLFQISSFTQKQLNDYPILYVFRTNQPPIRIFNPNTELQTAFAKVLTKLCAASEIGSFECDMLSLSLQKKVISSPTLQDFFKSFVKEENKATVNTPVPEESIPQKASPPTKQLKAIDIINGLIGESELLFFGVIVTIILILSVIFIFIPIGNFLCSIVFIFIAHCGFKMLFCDEDEDETSGKNDLEKQLSHIREFAQFKENIKNRFMWRNPRHTLEVALFLFASALLFSCYHPAFILAVSLFGFGFIERWNPFGFGSLVEIITNLFDFS